MSENYLIVGNDGYIRAREIRKIVSTFLSSEEEDLNYSTHTPSDIDGAKAALNTLPFLSEKRVVLLKEVQDLSESSGEDLVSYMERPFASSVLVISAGASFKKTGHYKKLSRLMKTVAADKPTPDTMKKWIRNFMKKHGVEISPRAVDLIVELKGVDTSGVRAELEKLAAYSGGDRIDVKEVEKLVGRSVTEAVFKLADAINSRNAKWAFRILNDLYNEKKSPQEIIGYLGWYTRVMRSIKLLADKGLGVDAIAGELGYSAAYVKRLKQQAEKYSAKKMEHWLSLLFRTDREIKSGLKNPLLAMDMLIAAFAA